MSNAIGQAALSQYWYDSGWWQRTTLAGAVTEAAARSADAQAVFNVEGRDHVLSVGEIDRAGRRLAGALTDMGLRAGDVVAVQMPSRPEAMITHRAIITLGLVDVPVIDSYGPTELNLILAQVSAKALFVSDRRAPGDHADVVAALSVPSLDTVVALSDRTPYVSWNDLVHRGWAADDADVDPDDVCLVQFTSGTSAVPKGVMHTHNTLLAERRSMAAFASTPNTQSQRGATLNILPSGHISTLLGVVGLFLGGATQIFIDRWSSNTAAQLIDQYRAQSTAGTPFFLSALLDEYDLGRHDLSSMRSFVVGAAPVPPSLLERADRIGWRCLRCYGSTEHPTVSAPRPSDSLERRAYSDGPPIPPSEVRVVDDYGNSVSADVEGEIVTRGPELFVGYWDRSLDDDVLLDDGWFRTGDIGKLDRAGYLTITDRVKDIIIRGGENISAKEIEDAIHCLPEIREAAVVAAPDERYGEQVCVFAILREGCDVSLDDLRSRLLGAGLARYKLPERMEIVHDLPRTATGKVRKAELRGQLAGGNTVKSFSEHPESQEA